MFIWQWANDFTCILSLLSVFFLELQTFLFFALVDYTQESREYVNYLEFGRGIFNRKT